MATNHNMGTIDENVNKSPISLGGCENHYLQKEGVCVKSDHQTVYSGKASMSWGSS